MFRAATAPKTINFYFYSDVPGLNGIELNGISITPVGQGTDSIGGGGSNLFRASNLPQTFPASGPNPPAGVAYWDFAGNAPGNDRFNVSLQVVLPTTLDVTAGGNIPFNIRYACQFGTGNGQTSLETGTFPAALTLNVNVLSALQASYVGTALDFGEVGDKTTTQVRAAPATFTTPITNHVNVRSSGPSSVALTSQNSYRLTFPGGSLGNAMHVLPYGLRFLGQTRTTASPTFSTVICMRAGVPASEADMLPVRATLLEGGQGKTPAANYSDILTVTVSPLLTGAPSQQNCPML